MSNDNIEQKPQEVVNPLLQNIQLPGQKFRMPSKGLMYDDGVLADDVIDGEVEVMSMSGLDEIYLKTPDLLFDGTAITKVFKRCIPQIKKPEKLLTTDVDYLLACLKKVSYGDILDFKVSCQKEVEMARKQEERLNRGEELGENEELIDINKLKKHEYSIKISNILTNQTTELDESSLAVYTKSLSNGQKVTFKPFTYSEHVAFATKSIEIETMEDDISDMDDIEEYAKSVVKVSILPLIKEVDGISDRNFVGEWLEEMSRSLYNEVNDHIRELPTFGSKFTYSVKCKGCGEIEEITSAVNPVGFFT